MAAIQGVIVTGVIVPSDTLDTYAVIDPIYGIDGLRNLTGGTSDLSLITTDRRRAGMLVGINNGASYYKLNPAPWTNTLTDWTPFTVGGGTTFTGGTVNGPTNYLNGLTANTFSATTYLGLPKDIVVTGGTYTAGTATFTNNSGGTFNVTGFTTTNLQKPITASYTATSADNNYTILVNNGGTAITITIPTGLLSKINIGFIQQGTADVTMTAGAGVTINAPANMLKIKGQHYWAYLEQVSNSNTYQLIGSLKL